MVILTNGYCYILLLRMQSGSIVKWRLKWSIDITPQASSISVQTALGVLLVKSSLKCGILFFTQDPDDQKRLSPDPKHPAFLHYQFLSDRLLCRARVCRGGYRHCPACLQLPPLTQCQHHLDTSCLDVLRLL